MAETQKPTLPVNSSAPTIAAQLERIKAHIAILRKLAIYLGETEDTTKEINKLCKITENPNSTLHEITEAYLSITNANPTLGSTAIQLGTTTEIKGAATEQVLTIPQGYYGKDTTFKIESLGNSSAVDNAPAVDEVVAGKDYWADGVHKTGTLTDYSSYKADNADESKREVVAATTNKEEAGATGKSSTVTITVPKGKYTDETVIDTGITARTTYAYDAEVVVSTDSEGDEHATIKTVQIPAGYYDKPIVVTPIFEASEDQFESIINTTDVVLNDTTLAGKLSNGTYTVTPGDNYDYITKVLVAEAVLNTTSELTVNASQATVVVPVTTKGYTTEDSYTVKLKPTAAPSEKDAAAKTTNLNVEITPEIGGAQSVTIPAGLYNKDVVIGVKSIANSGNTLTENNITVKDTPTLNADGDGYTVTVNVNNPGYIAAGDYVASDLDKATISVSNKTGNVINSDTFTISNTEGYVKEGDLAGNYSVQGAVVKMTATKGKVTIVTEGKAANGTTDLQPGWYEGGEFAINNSVIDIVATTSDAKFEYDDVKDLTNGINTTKYPGGTNVYYKKAETDLTDLVNELLAL